MTYRDNMAVNEIVNQLIDGAITPHEAEVKKKK